MRIVFILNKIIIFLLFLNLISCENKAYDCDDLEYKNGLNYEKSTGNLANGYFKCIEITNGLGNVKHATNSKYKNGLHSGKWTYHYQDQLIQKGEYLECPDLKTEIKDKSEAQIIEIEAWYEGDFGLLNIYIFSPKKHLDSLNLLSIKQNYTSNVCKQYNLQKVIFRQEINNEWLINSFQKE